LYWISYYLTHTSRPLDYFLNLTATEKEFYKESMEFELELEVKKDIKRIELLVNALYGEKR
jgi:hypothetical protein